MVTHNICKFKKFLLIILSDFVVLSADNRQDALCRSFPLQAAAELLNLLHNPVLLTAFQRRRLIVVIAGNGRYGTGNNICYVIFHQLTVFYGKRLLKNHCIFVRRITISSKAEISQTVNNIFPFVFLNSLKYMGMMTQNQIRPIVDGGMSQA